MKVTLNDIVSQTGLSVATISRVLNNSGYVKPETRALVAKALQQNDYQHSPRRRSVPHEISEIILVITGDITSSVYTSHIEGITKGSGEKPEEGSLSSTAAIPPTKRKTRCVLPAGTISPV